MSRSLTHALGIALAVTIGATTLAFAAPQEVVATQPADSALRDRIEYRLGTSRLVAAYDLTVKVDAGTAVLGGTVATSAQQAEAARLAKVDGIATVQNDITVDKSIDKTLADRAKSGMSKTGEAITDGWITTKVNWFFVGEDLLKGSHIDVDTAKNVVTVKGTVTSAAGRTRAVALAKQTSGVRRVVDQLKVVKS